MNLKTKHSLSLLRLWLNDIINLKVLTNVNIVISILLLCEYKPIRSVVCTLLIFTHQQHYLLGMSIKCILIYKLFAEKSCIFLKLSYLGKDHTVWCQVDVRYPKLSVFPYTSWSLKSA